MQLWVLLCEFYVPMCEVLISFSFPTSSYTPPPSPTPRDLPFLSNFKLVLHIQGWSRGQPKEGRPNPLQASYHGVKMDLHPCFFYYYFLYPSSWLRSLVWFLILRFLCCRVPRDSEFKGKGSLATFQKIRGVFNLAYGFVIQEISPWVILVYLKDQC